MERIDNILNKYWDAETSVQEEDLLRSYFASGEVAPEHKDVAELFAYQNILRGLTSTVGMTDLSLIEKQSSSTVVRQLGVRAMVGRIAAIGLVLLTAGWFVMSNLSTSQQSSLAHVVHLDDVQDKAETEEALEVTREALAYLTAKLDKNTRTVKTHVKNVQKANIFKY